ncbi:MAG: hypothetical protein ACRDY5_09180, partial [Acidimicrobiales bacterium]
LAPPPPPVDEPVVPAAPEPELVPTTGVVPTTTPAALPGDQTPVAPHARPTAAHGDTDKRSEAPIGMLLGTAGTMVAVGVAAALARRRRRRQLQLPPRAMAAPPPDEFDDLRAELCLRADTDHADRLHRAMRDVARSLADARSDAMPGAGEPGAGGGGVVPPGRAGTPRMAGRGVGQRLGAYRRAP